MRHQTTKILKILAVFFILLFIVIKSAGTSSILRIRFTDIISPALRSVNAILSAPGRLMPFASFREENKALRSKVELLQRKLDETSSVYEENQRLKNFLSFRQAIPYTTIPAQVIGRDASNWSNALILDKGLNQGVKPNKAAISTKGVVGRILEVGRYSSKILLITDPNSKVGVVIQRNRQGGILVGRPGGNCKMIYIALDSDVKRGDKVITAGYGSVFPKDILVGVVLRVGKEPGRLYKYAIVQPAQDLSKLEEVLCIK